MLGGHPESLAHALLVRQWSDDVIFFSHTVEPSREELTQLQARGVRLVSGAVARLVIEADRLTGVEMADGCVEPRTAVFIRPVNMPHSGGPMADIGCDVHDAGFIVVDDTGRTSAPGVWAAGNVVDPRFQVITAAGQGPAAAIAMNADLVREDLERALSNAADTGATERESRAGSLVSSVGHAAAAPIQSAAGEATASTDA